MQQLDSTNYHNLINSEKLTLVKYFGTWCGPYKVLTPILEGVIKNYSDINVGEVDIDTHMDLARKDGVRGVPTVVFYKNGVEVPNSRMVGLQPAQAYTQKIESLK
jgi:thioredoxin 1